MIEINVQEGPIAGIEAQTLIVLAFDGETPSAVDATVGGWPGEVYASGEFTGKACESAILYRPDGLGAKRLVLAGAGKRDRFDESAMRKAVATAVRSLKGKSLRDLHLW